MRARTPFKPTRRAVQQMREAAQFGTRLIGSPMPGWFSMRLARRAAIVGARIRWEPPADPETGERLDRSWMWHGDVDRWLEPRPSPSPTDRVWRIWTSAERITEREYDYLIETAKWSRENESPSAYHRPWVPLDLSLIDPRQLFPATGGYE